MRGVKAPRTKLSLLSAPFPATTMLRITSFSRSVSSSTTRQIPRALNTSIVCRRQSTEQTRKAHAISNPTLANIEKRWEAMPPQEQADLWMALRDRMKVDWNEMTLAEKKAGMCLVSLSCFLLGMGFSTAQHGRSRRNAGGGKNVMQGDTR